jgi:hypothetical protein
MKSSSGCFLKKLDGVPDRQDGFRGVVRNFDAELLFERLDEHDLVDLIGAKVVREIGAGDDFVF